MLKETIVRLQDSLEDEIVKGLNEDVPQAAPEEFTTFDNVLQLIGLCLLLVIILAAAYYTTRFVGKVKLGQLKHSNFEVIDSYRIGQNRMLQIVKIGNKYIVIAIGKDSINYITELNEAEIVAREVPEGPKQSFKQIFEKIKSNKQ